MGEKPDDWRTLPLCAQHHLTGPDAQHRTNERQWWERWGIYPPDQTRYFQHLARLDRGESGS
jgi:hypothetical protein